MRKRNRDLWWSFRARQDLEEIREYLYRVAPADSAERILTAFLAHSDQLPENPFMWPTHDIFKDMRFFMTRPYNVYYRVSEIDIEIVRILHGHQDTEAVLRTMARSRV